MSYRWKPSLVEGLREAAHMDEYMDWHMIGESSTRMGSMRLSLIIKPFPNRQPQPKRMM